MSIGSILTNNNASIALQALTSTSAQLETTQKRISTGLRVADARDDAGSFAVAQRVRGDINGITAANEQMGSAQGVLNTTLKGLENISKALGRAQGILTKLTDGNLNAEQRGIYNADFNAVRQQIANFVNDSSYNGARLLGTSAIGAPAGTNPTASTGMSVILNERGTTLGIAGTPILSTPSAIPGGTATLSHQFDLLNVATANITQLREYQSGVTATGSPSTARTFAQVEGAVNAAMARYGAASSTISSQMTFNTEKIAALESGVGSLVDADLTKESARLQSLQVRQQLGVTALSSANSAPQFLLSLFR